MFEKLIDRIALCLLKRAVMRLKHTDPRLVYMIALELTDVTESFPDSEKARLYRTHMLNKMGGFEL